MTEPRYCLACDGERAMLAELARLEVDLADARRRLARYEPMEGAEDVFLIVRVPSVVGNCALFWAPDRKGYTCDVDRAGRYSSEEAESITGDKRGVNVMVPELLIVKMAQRHVDQDALLSKLRALAAVGGKGR